MKPGKAVSALRCRLFLGERFPFQNDPAQEAERIGLVNHVYAPEALMEEAVEMARSFVKNSKTAVVYSKACIDRGMQVDIDNGIAIENEMFALCFGDADQKEGMTAFIEKRAANFKK